MANWSYTIKEGEYKGKTLWSGCYTAVAAFIFNFENGVWYVLANKRGSGTPDFQGYWNCPCGFLEDYESGEMACAREVREECGYDIPPNMFHFCGTVDTRPEHRNNGNITLRYICYLDESSIDSMWTDVRPKGGEENEVADVDWIPLDGLDEYDWAFGHEETIKKMKECLIKAML